MGGQQRLGGRGGEVADVANGMHPPEPGAIPCGTALINVRGCLLIGILMAGPELRQASGGWNIKLLASPNVPPAGFEPAAYRLGGGRSIP